MKLPVNKPSIDYSKIHCFDIESSVSKMKSPIALLLAVAASSTAFTQKRADAPTPPGLTHLLTANVTSGHPVEIGAVPEGTRIMLPLAGGTFEGPLLNGTILPVGVDASLMSPNGDFSPDGISIFQTSDGANIIYRGKGHQSGDHVYSAATFETGSEKYAWLNTAVGVSRALVSTGDTNTGIALEIFLVSSELLRRKNVISLNNANVIDTVGPRGRSLKIVLWVIFSYVARSCLKEELVLLWLVRYKIGSAQCTPYNYFINRRF